MFSLGDLFNENKLGCYSVQLEFSLAWLGGLTSQPKNFSDCFKSDHGFEELSSKWKKTLDSFCHQAFTKVRLTPNKPQVTKSLN